MSGKDDSALIESALVEAIQHLDGHEDGDILVEWVAVCYVTNIDEDMSGYPMLVSNDDMPTYRLRGLLHTALVKMDSPE